MIEAGNVSAGEPEQVVRQYNPIGGHCNGSFAPSKYTLPNVTEPLAIAAIPGMNNDQGHSAGPVNLKFKHCAPFWSRWRNIWI